MSKKLIITDSEWINYNKFINKFTNNNYNNLKTSAVIVDFSNEKHIEAIVEIIDLTLKESFQSIGKVFTNEYAKDYQYVNNNDRFNEMIKRVLYYSEINDIFDLFSNIYNQMITSHKLRNGNKRFCFFFLINLLYKFGFYFNWPYSLKNNNYEPLREREVFCFVSRLSNREYEDFASFSDSELRLDNDKSQIYKWCYNLIKENDKSDTVKQRQDKVRKEIKSWIMNNVIIKIEEEVDKEESSTILEEYVKNIDKHVEPLEKVMKQNGDWDKLVKVLLNLSKM